MLKMRRSQGSRHFQISKAISTDMEAGETGEHRNRSTTPLTQVSRTDLVPNASETVETAA